MTSAHQLSRAYREPGYKAPGPGDGEPPAFMVAPTTIARAAVRLLHTSDAASAKLYLAESKVGQWTSHDNASMASGARAVVDGFDWYVHQDAADGRLVSALDVATTVALPAGSLDARLDVVLYDGTDLAGRVVLWDVPAAAEAATLLYAAAWVLDAGSATTEGLQALM